MHQTSTVPASVIKAAQAGNSFEGGFEAVPTKAEAKGSHKTIVGAIGEEAAVHVATVDPRKPLEFCRYSDVTIKDWVEKGVPSVVFDFLLVGGCGNTSSKSRSMCSKCSRGRICASHKNLIAKKIVEEHSTSRCGCQFVGLTKTPKVFQSHDETMIALTTMHENLNG